MVTTTVSALDAFLRHQINVERYKNYNVQQSFNVLAQIKQRVAVQLVKTGKDKLSDLSKREFNQFIKDFTKGYNELFGKYETAQLAEFKKFFKADFGEQKFMFGKIGGKAYRGPNADAMWATMQNEPASGIGVEPKRMFKVFSANAQNKIVAALKVGYTDNLTMADVMKSIAGTSELKLRDGLINRFEAQLTATVQTYIQQMVSFLTGGIGGSLNDKYQWVSILDSNTTQICRSRDGHIYKYGDGPMPPAHYNCRSTPIPVIDAAIKEMPTFFAWLQMQPPVIQDEVLGKRQGGGLRSGRVTADDIPRFNQMSPLTLEQFKGKRNQLLTVT
jgi:SPP1 gp7 family putative phage head morphogenesis protein